MLWLQGFDVEPRNDKRQPDDSGHSLLFRRKLQHNEPRGTHSIVVWSLDLLTDVYRAPL